MSNDDDPRSNEWISICDRRWVLDEKGNRIGVQLRLNSEQNQPVGSGASILTLNPGDRLLLTYGVTASVLGGISFGPLYGLDPRKPVGRA